MFELPSDNNHEFHVTLPYAKEKIEKVNFTEKKA
jgi:hypothetical protein